MKKPSAAKFASSNGISPAALAAVVDYIDGKFSYGSTAKMLEADFHTPLPPALYAAIKKWHAA
jgi:hypothetical protein